jgi:glycosyltransferase involved in cell wall biosynthesis
VLNHLRRLISKRDSLSPPPFAGCFAPSERFAGAPFNPTVTVVVPNYNHAAFLRQRLDSIYCQTYQNFDVLLLDDCSPDDSRSILAQYQSQHPHKTRLIVSEKNSGAPFPQWQKGIALATGELIWIAESDDFCARDFLEKLVVCFRDEAVQLAYARTVFVNVTGQPAEFSFQDHVEILSATKWTRSYVATAHQEVNEVLGIKNSIPNVSGVLFRKSPLHDFLLDEHWSRMKICGDWIFYLHVIRGGKLAYRHDTANYYRFHPASTSSVARHRQFVYYQEHGQVAQTLAQLYRLSDSVIAAHHQLLRDYWVFSFKNQPLPDWQFADAFNLADINAAQARRLPNILIVGYDFSTGGGETFPIGLAVELKRLGYGVTFLDFHGSTPNPQFRQRLPAGIPVVQRNQYLTDHSGLVSDLGIDIIHTHHLTTDVYAADLCRQLRAAGVFPVPRHVVTLHGMYEFCPDSFQQEKPKLIDSVDHWVYVADKNVLLFGNEQGQPGRRFSKITVGTKIQTVVPCERRQWCIPETAFVICVVSRAIPEKGWQESVTIVQRAREITGRDIHLLLVGEGPVKDELQTIGVPPHVHLLGFQAAVSGLYALADLGMLMTTYTGESCPMSLIECLAAGRPVVASELGDIRAMIIPEADQAAGWVIPLNQMKVPVEQVAAVIARLVTNPSVYQAAKANCAAAAAPYSLDRIARQYGEVYAQALQDPPTFTVAPSNRAGSPAGDGITDVQQQLWIKRQSELSPDLRHLLFSLTRRLVNRPRVVRLMVRAARLAARLNRRFF